LNLACDLPKELRQRAPKIEEEYLLRIPFPDSLEFRCVQNGRLPGRSRFLVYYWAGYSYDLE